MSVTVLNTTASLSGKTLLKAEDSQTITGQKTFDVGASAPFVVVSGAAKVANLDADLLDGEEGADFHDASLLATGTVPTARLGSGTADANSFLSGDQTYKQVGTGLDIVNGRLSLTTGLPVTIADVTAATTLYWALYQGNKIALYSGSQWLTMTIAQLSIAVPATTSQMYDVFVDYNAGTPILSLTAWTNDTTRTTALTTQDGVLVLTGSTGKRYVGSFRTTGVSGQTEDSAAKRYVWNYYNRVPRRLFVQDATASWNYTTATIRQANGAAGNQVELIVGVQEAMLDLRVSVSSYNNSGAAIRDRLVGIGEDSTTVLAVGSVGGLVSGNSGSVLQMASYLSKMPVIGRHFYAWLEASQANDTTTWYSSAGPSLTWTNMAAGLSGTIDG